MRSANHPHRQTPRHPPATRAAAPPGASPTRACRKRSAPLRRIGAGAVKIHLPFFEKFDDNLVKIRALHIRFNAALIAAHNLDRAAEKALPPALAHLAIELLGDFVRNFHERTPSQTPKRFRAPYHKLSRACDQGMNKCGLTIDVLQLKTAKRTGRSSAWLERLVWDQEVAGSNPVAPIRRGKTLKARLSRGHFFAVVVRQTRRVSSSTGYRFPSHPQCRNAW